MATNTPIKTTKTTTVSTYTTVKITTKVYTTLTKAVSMSKPTIIVITTIQL